MGLFWSGMSRHSSWWIPYACSELAAIGWNKGFPFFRSVVKSSHVSLDVFTLLFHFDNAAQSFFSLHLFLSNFACSVLCWNAHNLIRNLIRDLLSTLSPHSLHQLSLFLSLCSFILVPADHSRGTWPLNNDYRPRRSCAELDYRKIIC